MHGDAELARLSDTLKAQLRLNDARVPDLTVYNRYLPTCACSVAAAV